MAVGALGKAMAELEERLAEAESGLLAAEGEAGGLRGRLEQAEEERKAAECQAETAAAEAAALGELREEEMRARIEEKTTSLALEVNEVRALLARAAQEREGFQERLAAAQSRENELEVALERERALGAELDSFQERLTAAQSREKELEADLERERALRAELDRARKEAEAGAVALGLDIAGLRGQVEEERARGEGARAEADRLRGLVDGAEGRVVSLGQELEESQALQGQLEQLQERTVTLEQELEGARALGGEVDQLRAQVAALEEEIEATRAEAKASMTLMAPELNAKAGEPEHHREERALRSPQSGDKGSPEPLCNASECSETPPEVLAGSPGADPEALESELKAALERERALGVKVSVAEAEVARLTVGWEQEAGSLRADLGAALDREKALVAQVEVEREGRSGAELRLTRAQEELDLVKGEGERESGELRVEVSRLGEEVVRLQGAGEEAEKLSQEAAASLEQVVGREAAATEAIKGLEASLVKV
ncbi:unnamed protein product, partial [Discosporangium mesarthrocarpum]